MNDTEEKDVASADSTKIHLMVSSGNQTARVDLKRYHSQLLARNLFYLQCPKLQNKSSEAHPQTLYSLINRNINRIVLFHAAKSTWSNSKLSSSTHQGKWQVTKLRCFSFQHKLSNGILTN
jgi:hypothetical protein